MNLLTDEIKARLPKLYATDGMEERDVIVKFFTPWSNWTWYIVEGEPEKGDNGKEDYRLFGWVEGHENEWGYVMLSELESIKGTFGLRVERDLYFDNMVITRSGEVKKKPRRKMHLKNSTSLEQKT